MTTPGLELPPLLRDGDFPDTALAVFDTLGTARAIRHLGRDPVADSYVDALVWAATRASSAANAQPWEFVAVTDEAQRTRIAEAVAGFGELSKQLEPATDARGARLRDDAVHLQRNLAQAPLLLFVCGRNDYPSIRPQERYLWSAVFGATQNVVVAARALGLSAVLTMLHVANPGGVRALLGVPADHKIAAMLAIGWPDRAPGPVRRRPVRDVLHRDRW